MPYAFNFIVILMVGLIAYWWANQGLLSAILHMLCVIVAGAVAFAVWEPLTVGLLLRNTQFDDYAWGISLVSVFAITLLVLRVTFDKLVRGNVDLPQWAHLTFGFPVGAIAGILTIDIVLIGAGHIQSNTNILGVVGTVRSAKGTVKVQEVDNFWLPVHQLTFAFYSYLSLTSLYPTMNDTPLAHVEPDGHLNAISLLRDSALGGRGKLSLRPKDARIDQAVLIPEANRFVVKVHFDTGARDFGEQLTLSQSQVRLIASAGDHEFARYLFPVAFLQHSGRHLFDDLSHYVTSQPGQQQTDVLFEFDISSWRTATGHTPPKYIQIRKARYALPKQGSPQFRTMNSAELAGLMGGSFQMGSGAGSATFDASARNIQDLVEVTNDIRPIQASVNALPAGIQVTDRYISGGDGDFVRGSPRVSRQLQIEGIFEPSQTRIVKVDISRGKAADIFEQNMRNRITDKGSLMLIDSSGRSYRAIGYMHDRPDGKTRIKVDTTNLVDSLEQLPPLPTSGAHTLKLLFNVTENATIVAFKGGEVTIGTCNVPVTPKRR